MDESEHSQLGLADRLVGLAGSALVTSGNLDDGMCGEGGMAAHDETQQLFGVKPPSYSLEQLSELLAGASYYSPTSLIGQGSFGIVLRGVDRRPECTAEVAIKLLPRGDLIRNYRTYVKREIIHQSSLRHPLIITLREVFLTPTHLGMAMEYAPGGDLHRFLNDQPGRRLVEEDARWLFQQLIIGLDYCHRRGVANRDLKLENLLLDAQCEARPLLKICDFGFSKHELNSMAKTGVGTVAYMAPEIILGDNKYDAKCADMWSCGVILFTMLCGRYPFDAKEPKFARKVVEAAFEYPPDVSVSLHCRQVVALLLAPDPKRRASIADIVQHPWFQSSLPEGALSMNDALLLSPLNLETEHYRVDQLIDNAEHPGRVGDPLQAVRL